MKLPVHLLLIPFVLAGCSRTNSSPGTTQSGAAAKIARATADEPKWVETVRNGGIPQNFEEAPGKAWLSNNLAVGKTRKADVLTLFGSPGRSTAPLPHDLDRPKRDGVSSAQYLLWSDGRVNWGCLVFHLDTKTDLLLDWEISWSICGYCPHIYARDDDWHLEGKMLAGCIGNDRRGTDTLLLPRLTAHDGSLRIKLANLAPETDYVSRLTLAAIPLEKDEELDISADGNPVVWRAVEERPVEFRPDAQGNSQVAVHLNHPGESDVLVLELRNTAAFESEMRRVFLDGKPAGLEPGLVVDFGNGKSAMIQPIGTKFLRRVVVALPEGTSRVNLQAPGRFWYTRRLWLGKKCEPTKPLLWLEPAKAQAIVLAPMEDAVVEFPAHTQPANHARVGYAHRIEGYYEFLQQL